MASEHLWRANQKRKEEQTLEYERICTVTEKKQKQADPQTADIITQEIWELIDLVTDIKLINLKFSAYNSNFPISKFLHHANNEQT